MYVANRSGPGLRDTFKIDEASKLLSEKPRQLFHSTVARLLYLASHKLLVHSSNEGDGERSSQAGKTFGIFETHEDSEALYWGNAQQATQGLD